MVEIRSFRDCLYKATNNFIEANCWPPKSCTVVVSCEQATQWLQQEGERLWRLFQISLSAHSEQEGVEAILRTVMPKETKLHIIFVHGNAPVRVMLGTYEEIG